MSHIPASKMPHAHAEGDTIDEQPPQPNNAQPEPEPTTATPLTSQAPATATGNREGSSADETARDAGAPQAAGGATAQPAVDGTVTAQGENADAGSDATSTASKVRSGLRSRTGIAALAIGGLAIAGGIAAALFPRGQAKDEGKSKKRRRKKS
ncbi:hypothetical protein [Sphingomonas lenta]|uniref:Uncharacterized protein n=1 Tax=Sphingomonas lenta TaxID=1141887 RepID=A0A2A2SJ93_9SPHN|nr:hypothetical protein [Sphingomonas lenta]PAX09354.1 hypothetical protein CKY28_00940 [Sphingomonas lenta]